MTSIVKKNNKRVYICWTTIKLASEYINGAFKMSNVEIFKKEFNGHPDWQHWNVSLWLNNSEEWYAPFAVLCDLVNRGRITKDVASEELKELIPDITPDGAEVTVEILHYYITDAEIDHMEQQLRKAQ